MGTIFSRSSAIAGRGALRLATGLLLGTSALCFAVAAHAEQAEPAAQAGDDNAATRNDEILVTARRRTENVQDIPMSIAAIGGDALAERGVVENRDVAKLVSGLTWKAGSSTTRNNVFVRGVGNANVAYSSSPAVAVYLDDTYLNAQSLNGFSAFDIERVEVLKGPQGTLYGRNTTGGAIKFVTTKPIVGAAATGNASLEVGNYGYVKAEAAVSVPLGDIAALRIAGYSVDRGGMFRDYINGDRLVDRDVKAVRATLAIEPTDRFSMLLTGTYGRSNSDNMRYKRIDYADPSTIGFDPDFGPYYTGVCANPTVGTAPGCTNLFIESGLDTPDLNHSKTAIQSNLRRGQSPEKNEVYGGALSLNYDFGGATLTSATSYYHNDVLDTQDPDGSVGNLIVLQDTARPRQFSQEIRIASNGNPDFRYVAGAFYFREKLRATAPVSLTGFGIGFGAAYEQVTTSKALFAEGSYRLTPQLDLTVGLRYSNDRKVVDFDHYFFVPDNRLTIGYADIVNDLGLIPDFSVNGVKDSSNSLSGRISLSYKPNDDLMVYATASRGFKGAEFNVGSDNPATAGFVKPETVNAFEIGLKSDFLDRAITLNLAGYYYDYKDKQETIFDTGVARLANAQARVWGLDGEITIRPTQGLTFSGNFSLLDAKYKSFLSCTPAGDDCDGNRLPNAPKFTTQLMVRYEIPIGERTIALQADANYRSKTDFSPLNYAFLQEPSYWLFGARASVEVNDKVEIAAWIKNIGNKRYFQDMFDVSQVGYSEGLPGEPRTFGVTLSGHF